MAEPLRSNSHPDSWDNSLTQEMGKLMKEFETSDPAVVITRIIVPRLAILIDKSPEERELIRQQGNVLKSRREALSLSYGQVAIQAGISATELMLIEYGFPPVNGPEDLYRKLESILGE